MTSPVKVMQVAGVMNVGGAETLLMRVFRAIDRSEVQFDFVSFGDAAGAYDEEIRDLGGSVRRMRSPRTAGPRRFVTEMAGLLRQGQPYDAVHAHVLHANAGVLVGARLAHVPRLIAHSHNTGSIDGSLSFRSYAWTARHTMNRVATHWLACSEDAGTYLYGDRKWSRFGEVIPNGLDPSAYGARHDADARTLLAEWGLPPLLPVVGSVARLERVKNHAFLIDLCAAARRVGRDFSLVVAGEGAERARLESMVRTAGLEDRVRLLGLRGDVPALLRAYDVLAMPSLHEGVPLCLIEAQASGLPAIVSADVGKESDLGMGLIDFVPRSHPGLWLDAISARSRPEVRQGASEEFTNSAFDVQVIANRLSDIYRMAPVAHAFLNKESHRA